MRLFQNPSPSMQINSVLCSSNGFNASNERRALSTEMISTTFGERESTSRSAYGLPLRVSRHAAPVNLLQI